jgi:PAS domain S-box-containing protein
VAFSTNLLQAAPVGILTYRLTGECVSCNAAAAQIVGAPVEELEKQNFNTLHSWKQSGLLDLAERAIAKREPQTSKIAMVTSFGRVLWLLVRLAVFRSMDEDLLLLVLGDITELKRIEDELLTNERVLRASQAELRKLSRAIEQSPSPVIITDREGAIEYVNPSFSALSGYAPEDVIGRNPRIFKSGEGSGDLYLRLWSTITSGGTWRGELHNRKKDGTLYWVRATISPIFDDRGTITNFVAIQEDIGPWKVVEEAAAESERRFLGVQKMEALGRLAGGIAHDFNNLLTAILGYSEFLLMQVADHPALKADVEEIRKAGERVARLTRQLLAFSRKQRLDPENVNLNQVVGDLAKMVARVIGEDVRLDVATADELGLARLDPGQTEQVLMNLVVNARDAMPKGGRLAITTANVDLDEEFVERHPGAKVGSYVAVSVRDTGTGMPPEVLGRMFEPFFTTKPLGQGTGLGLATVYGIVKQSSGHITVQSEPGAGTTVTCYFPRLGADASAPQPEAPPDVPEGGHETILLVEDEPMLREVVHRVLEQYGYRVLLASDGNEALAIAADHRGVIDLLVSDVVMPELSGPDLAERLARSRPTMRVLYISGFAPRVGSGSAPIGPQTAFLPKPFTPEALARKVREVLGRRSSR